MKHIKTSDMAVIAVFSALIAVLSMIATMISGFGVTASAAVEGDESNKAFDYCVIDNKFSEININALKNKYWENGYFEYKDKLQKILDNIYAYINIINISHCSP